MNQTAGQTGVVHGAIGCFFRQQRWSDFRTPIKQLRSIEKQQSMAASGAPREIEISRASIFT
jgi:hypothetical protein